MDKMYACGLGHVELVEDFFALTKTMVVGWIITLIVCMETAYIYMETRREMVRGKALTLHPT